MNGRYTADQGQFFPATFRMARYTLVDNIVLLAEAKFSTGGRQSWTLLPVRTPTGGFHRERKVSIPIQDRGRPGLLLRDTIIHQPSTTIDKFLRVIRDLYVGTIGFRQYWDSLVCLMGQFNRKTPVCLNELNRAILEWGLEIGSYVPKIHWSTDIVEQRDADASEWLAHLGKALNCTEYVCGESSIVDYMRLEPFQENRIAVIPQKYRTPGYDSGRGSCSASFGFLDPLFRLGKDGYCQLITDR